MKSEKQHIRCRIIIEVLGKPKEHVEKTIKEYIEKIKKDPDLIILKTDFAETKQQDNFFTTFAELEMVIKGIPKLIGFCFDYMPSSLEIIKPDELILDNKAISDFLNDLQARLHSMDMVVKQLKNENEFLKRNMNNVIKNVILVALAQAKLNQEQLTKITGIVKKELEMFLNTLVENKSIKKEGDLYSIIKNGESKA
ncbi:hypothetical protein ISS05_03965 [Candidatus Woesearchaeota archaeon]|nr:hypothetical protein [Candidatus Woesearchaeota archaeon]